MGSYGEFLRPQLERAIRELSEDLADQPDADHRRQLIAFFRRTIAECMPCAEPGAVSGHCRCQ